MILITRNIVFNDTKYSLFQVTCRCASLIPVNNKGYIGVRDYSKQAKHHTHAERKYQSDSESDSDLDEWIGHRVRLNFLLVIKQNLTELNSKNRYYIFSVFISHNTVFYE